MSLCCGSKGLSGKVLGMFFLFHSILYLCFKKLRKECNLLEMSVG